MPYGGDHGPDTAAQRAGTTKEAVPDDKNGIGRKLRIERLWWMLHNAKPHQRISQRQYQAGMEIRNAYCRVEMLSSGDALREQVDSSARPDAAIAAQIDAMSRLKFVMDAVPGDMRSIVEHVCWHNRPVHRHEGNKAMLQVALDLVANKLRF